MANKHRLFGLLFPLLALILVSRESIAANAPTVSIAASPQFVTAGEHSRITWSSTNATQCVASGHWTGIKPLSDSKNTGHITSNETYALTCTGPGGSASNHVNVVVTSGGTGSTAPPVVSITANPSTVSSGGKTTISWLASNATGCSGSGA